MTHSVYFSTSCINPQLMKRKVFRIIGWIFLLLLIYACWFLSRMLPVATGFAAKNMCSGLWVMQKDSATIKKTDLGFFPVKFTSEKIDWQKKTVTSTLFGLFTQTAVYREGLGASLLPKGDVETFRTSLPFSLPARPYDPDTTVWPMGNKVSIEQTRLTEKLKITVAEAFLEKDSDHLLNTRAVIVVRNNQLLAEQYAAGFDLNTKLIGWSMSKSITSLWLGNLIHRGQASLTGQPVMNEWSSDERKDISLIDLLHMSSGLDWEENYDKLSPATQMLYKENDMAAYAAGFKQKKPHGSEWMYSSGTTNIISGHIKSKFSVLTNYLSDPYTELLYKIGMLNTQLETDAANTYVGSSYTYATARDWARFGMFCLNNGIANGEQLLPDGWMKFVTTPAEHATCAVYGGQFWLNNPTCKDNSVDVFPDCPQEMYYCDGFKGQFVVMIPSMQLVIVRLGYCSNYAPHLNSLVSNIIKDIKNTEQ